MAARSAWGAPAWGNAGGANAERLVLPKSEQECPLCLSSKSEVKLEPCKHEVCLECCNKMRQANIFKVDAGIRCALCNDYVEVFTDLNGNPSSVSSLRLANEAAQKSLAARTSGSQQSVSTAVPDRSRLIPGSSTHPPRGEPSWCCERCQRLNKASKERCIQCNALNPRSVRPHSGGLDALTCTEMTIIDIVKEKGHYALKQAMADAGEPWLDVPEDVNVTIANVRDALTRKGHERLMRMVYLLTVTPGSNLIDACNNDKGTFGMQKLLDAVLVVSVQAKYMEREGHRLHEDFETIPGGSSSITAVTAFSQLVAKLAEHSKGIVVDAFGMYVASHAVAIGGVEDVLVLARQMVQDFPQYSPTAGQINKEVSKYMCNVVNRLVNICFEEGPQAAVASAETLNTLLAEYRHHGKVLNAHSRHPHLGGAIIEAAQGALPRVDAFRTCHMLATSAGWVAQTKGGVQTLTQMVSLLSEDPLGRKMIRDIACCTALALTGYLSEVACSITTGGYRLVKALLEVLGKEREDAWVLAIITELVEGGLELEEHNQSFDVLIEALAMPQLDAATFDKQLYILQNLGVGSLRQEVMDYKSNRRLTLEPPFFADKSEYQPTTRVEVVTIKKRLPEYVRELIHEERKVGYGENGGSSQVHSEVTSPRASLDIGGAPAAHVPPPVMQQQQPVAPPRPAPVLQAPPPALSGPPPPPPVSQYLVDPQQQLPATHIQPQQPPQSVINLPITGAAAAGPPPGMQLPTNEEEDHWDFGAEIASWNPLGGGTDAFSAAAAAVAATATTEPSMSLLSNPEPQPYMFNSMLPGDSNNTGSIFDNQRPQGFVGGNSGFYGSIGSDPAPRSGMQQQQQQQPQPPQQQPQSQLWPSQPWSQMPPQQQQQQRPSVNVNAPSFFPQNQTRPQQQQHFSGNGNNAGYAGAAAAPGDAIGTRYDSLVDMLQHLSTTNQQQPPQQPPPGFMPRGGAGNKTGGYQQPQPPAPATPASAATGLSASISSWTPPPQQQQNTMSVNRLQTIQNNNAVRPLGAAPATGTTAEGGFWACPACTYLHLGKEAAFLNCTVCGARRPV